MTEFVPCFVNTYIFLFSFSMLGFINFAILLLLNPNFRFCPNLGMFLSFGLGFLIFYYSKDYLLYNSCEM